jgi:GAF domain-containing protein
LLTEKPIIMNYNTAKADRMNAPLPENEAERLATLRAYQILDTPPDAELNLITTLASRICSTPIALVSLVDERRQWFKSKFGLSMAETDRNIAFCGHAILQWDVMEVGDARADHRFADNPLVTADPSIRFYAGAPLMAENGCALGTVCVLDYSPRTLTSEQRSSLSMLGELTMGVLNFRKKLQEISRVASEREWLINELQQALVDAMQR